MTTRFPCTTFARRNPWPWFISAGFALEVHALLTHGPTLTRTIHEWIKLEDAKRVRQSILGLGLAVAWSHLITGKP